ncbi:MAG TPA: hypothetical protein VMD30_00845, partial [Tepidisphaeraceae bacterium]|nr:hypothetical protein [Tepidisphaeraceae bacterium]
SGCASQPPPSPLPQYPLLDAPRALAVLRSRADSIHTLSGACTLVLTREDGQSVQLDAAVAMAPPDYLRLRAWKAGQVVFDLTSRPDGLWIETADDPRAKTLPASMNASRFSKALLEFTGAFFDQASVASSSQNALIFRRGDVFCQVDRRTLTASRYWIVDSAGRTAFTLDLSDYTQLNGIAWPEKFVAIQQGGDRIDIQFDTVNINTGLARGAFIPPRRAEKRS